MDWVLWLAIVLMFAGIAGTFLPIIPGLPLIFFTALAYGFYDGFKHVSAWVMVFLLILTALGQGVDYFAGVLGAKRYGASKYGTYGALFGGLLGILFLPWGLLLFPPIGAVVGELISGSDLDKALNCAWGTCLGMLGGAVAKVIIAVIMTGTFIWEVVH